MLWPLLRWVLFRFDPETIHRIAHRALHLVPVGFARWRRPAADPRLAVRCLGLAFDGPVGLAAGFDDYLPKPLRIEDLAACLNRICLDPVRPDTTRP